MGHTLVYVTLPVACTVVETAYYTNLPDKQAQPIYTPFNQSISQVVLMQPNNKEELSKCFVTPRAHVQRG